MKNLNRNKPILIITVLMIMIFIVLGSILAVENIRMNKAYISEYIQEYDTKVHKIDPNLFSLNDDFIFDSDVNDKVLFTDVGEYDCLIKISNNNFLFVKSKIVPVKYIIKDTVAPVFDENTPDEIEVYKDCEIENIEEIFKATDLAPVTISIDKEGIDFTTVGEYVTNIYALDKYDNVTNKEIKVKVLEPTVELDKTTVDATVGESVNISATVKGKDQTITWTSSDESIATVENGTVTAKNVGKVTITAKANDVTSTCEITIKAKSVASTPSNNGRNNNNSRPSSNSSNSSSSNTSNSSSSSSSNNNSENTQKPVWCWEGGSKHVISVGIGWYSSYNAAKQAGMAKIGNGSGSWEVQECDCGKFTVYVKID